LIQHKIHISNGIKSGQFDKHLIAFSETKMRQAKWVDAHEFEWQNEKYDVVKKQISTSGVIYFCINDKVEKKLSEALAQAAQKSKTQQSHTKQLILFCMPLPTSNVFVRSDLMHLSVENAYLLAGHGALPFQPPTV
jgi:hypothetical protein